MAIKLAPGGPRGVAADYAPARRRGSGMPCGSIGKGADPAHNVVGHAPRLYAAGEGVTIVGTTDSPPPFCSRNRKRTPSRVGTVILHPSYLHPSSFILHPSSFILPMRYEPATSADLDALVDLLVEAYHADRAWVAEGLTRRGIDTFRLARSGPQIQAALELIAAGQWFGGRCVPSGTVAWVTTRVAARGTGAARELIASGAGGDPNSGHRAIDALCLDGVAVSQAGL